MAAGLVQGGTSWDDMLDAAVLQGLTSRSGAEAALSLSLCGSGSGGSGGGGGCEAEGAEDELVELHGTLTQDISAGLQAAVARSVTLLRRGSSSAELESELEWWMLEGGRMQALGYLRLQPGLHAVAAWIAHGCIQDDIRLQPALHRGGSLSRTRVACRRGLRTRLARGWRWCARSRY